MYEKTPSLKASSLADHTVRKLFFLAAALQRPASSLPSPKLLCANSSRGIYSSNMDNFSEAAETSNSASNNMDWLPEAAEVVMPVSASVPNWMLTTDDQRFLLLFVFGIYFGPDLKEEMHKKSALQRIAEDIPPYTLDQLVGSHMKTKEVERIYYYILRNADQSVKVKLPLLQNFCQGCLFFPSKDSVVDQWQFPDLFPKNLHPQILFNKRYKGIKNIIFLNNPEISYIKPEDLERFKRLSQLEDLSLDKDAAKSFGSIGVSGPVVKPKAGTSKKMLPKKTHLKSENNSVDDYIEAEIPRPSTQIPGEAVSAIRLSGIVGKTDAGPLNRQLPKETHQKSQNNQQAEQVDACMEAETPRPSTHVFAEQVSAIPFSSIPYNGASNTESLPVIGAGQPAASIGPAMFFLPSYPTVEEWNNVVNAVKTGIAVTGTAAERRTGPIIGLVDVGEDEEAYLFRVSLPGVSRDPEHFRINIETNGTVHIEGVTTTGTEGGKRYVSRYSRDFEMLTQHLCPSGAFSVTFRLPGPVAHKQLFDSFWSEGIYEGIVEKAKAKSF